MIRRALIPLLTVAASPAAAEAPEIVTLRYACERGVEVPAAYVNTAGGGVVVLSVEGRQIALAQGISASGVRYEWPSGGSGYIWHAKGDEAVLLWHDGESGAETPLLSGCSAR
jgi:membrane-bound inhibitor of C-type lysozyme